MPITEQQLLLIPPKPAQSEGIQNSNKWGQIKLLILLLRRPPHLWVKGVTH